MKIFIIGSIGYGGKEQIIEISNFLIEKGYEILDQFGNKGLDFSKIDDFRDKLELSKEIINLDLEFVQKANILVLVTNGPSFGAAFEICEARVQKKPVILFAPKKIPTPWPIAYVNDIAKTKKELILKLEKYKRVLFSKDKKKNS